MPFKGMQETKMLVLSVFGTNDSDMEILYDGISDVTASDFTSGPLKQDYVYIEYPYTGPSLAVYIDGDNYYWTTDVNDVPGKYLIETLDDINRQGARLDDVLSHMNDSSDETSYDEHSSDDEEW